MTETLAILFGHMLLAGLATFLGCQRLRLWLIERQVIDRPNERSSHAGVVPRGAGLVVVLVTVLICLVSYFLLAQHPLLTPIDTDSVARTPALVVLGAMLVLMLLGFIDDARGLGIGIRLIVESALAALAVTLLMAGIDDTPVLFSGSFTAKALAVVFIVWMVNLYNFMDGIDLISVQQTVISALVLAVWFWWVEAGHLVLLVCVLVAVMLGFTPFNLPPARMFLGDSGSLALGGCFAILALIGVIRYGLPLLAFVVLYGVYLTDSGVTLIRRLLTGANILKAHREHYYQRAVLAGESHWSVSARLAAVNAVLALLATGIVLASDAHRQWISVLSVSAGIVLLLYARRWVRRREAAL